MSVPFLLFQKRKIFINRGSAQIMQVTEVEYIVQWAEENRSYEQKYKE